MEKSLKVGKKHGKYLTDIEVYPILHKKKMHLSHLNLKKTKPNMHVIDKLYYIPNVEIQPRIPDVIYYPPDRKAIRTPWTWDIALMRSFKGAKGDSKRMIIKCFIGFNIPNR